MIEVEKTTRWVPKPSGRGGRSQVVHVAYLGDLRAEGKTAAEAKAALLALAEKVLTGGFTPRFIRRHGWEVFIWRQVDAYGDGWRYKIIGPDHDNEKHGTVLWGAVDYPTEHETESRARFHLAQILMTPDEPFRGWDLLDNDHDRDLMVRDANFQQDMRVLMAAGIDLSDAHRLCLLGPWPDDIERPARITAPEQEVSTTR